MGDNQVSDQWKMAVINYQYTIFEANFPNNFHVIVNSVGRFVKCKAK